MLLIFLISQAYSLHIASLLSNEDAKKFYDNIEDVLEQADEADKTFLQVIFINLALFSQLNSNLDYN